ncbi:MAG: alpha-glucosidase C-terminal domain-containing protein [Phycisphaerae bacterium]|nr:alpha-glucosidase C-terminal domain-containing protein [Phycisphaerae bacterium]
MVCAALAAGSLAFGSRAGASEFPPRVPVATSSGTQAQFKVPNSVRVARAGEDEWKVTFTVPAREAGSSKTVQVAGDFTGWQGQAISLKKQSNGDWIGSADIHSGRRLYKFILDGGRWISDPANAMTEPDGQGGNNSVLLLGVEASIDPASARLGDGVIEGAALGHSERAANDRQRAAGEWLIRYRTLHGDVSGVTLSWRSGKSEGERPMARVARVGPLDVWEAALPALTGVAAYTFILKDGPLTVRDPKVYSLDPSADGGFQTPDWAKNAVWYQVMVERFANGNTANDRPNTLPWTHDWPLPVAHEGKDGQTFYRHFVFDRFFGGDLAGLQARLPYLKDLGVNALYLMPMFQATTPHKYNTTNFLHIDENFGAGGDYAAAAAKEDLLDPRTWTFNDSDKQFIAFLAEAKRQGFRVVIDGVFNHVGTHHPAFQDVKLNGKTSPFAEWFDIKSWDPFVYDAWWGFSELPVLKKDPVLGIASAAARKHILDVTKRWMDPNGDGDPSDGVDGWRLDVPNEVPIAFWREWRSQVKKINPNAYISGEIWERADQYLKGDAFDGVMNYEFCKPAFEWIGNRTQKIKASELDSKLGALRVAYPAEAHYAMMNLLDSHDTDRVSSMLKNPDRVFNQQNRDQDGAAYDQSKPGADEYAKQRLLALLQMTYVGAPMIYYGDEVGMWGASDPNNRKPMLWQDKQPYQNPQDAPNLDLLAYYKQIIALRNAHAALRTGSFRTVLTDDAQDVWVFLREGGGEQVLVALNASDKAASVDLKDMGSGWTVAWSGAPAADVRGVRANAPAAASAVGAAPSVPARSGCGWVRKAP